MGLPRIQNLAYNKALDHVRIHQGISQMAKSPQTVGEALEQAKKERAEAQGPEAKRQVIEEQVADALIGIRWALIGISTGLSRR